MPISQFNASYHPVQDRIKLCMSTTENQEYVLWLTRKITVDLLRDNTVQNKNSDFEKRPKSSQEKIIEQFKKEATFQSAKFDQAYKAPENRPLGPNPDLVTSINIEEQEHTSCLTIKTRRNIAIKLTMSHTLKYQLQALLFKVAQAAEWQLGEIPLTTTFHTEVKLNLH